MPTLRIATFNALSGRRPGARLGEVPAPQALERSVVGLDADVVALQEVDAFQQRSDSVDQVGRLLAALSADGDQWSGRLLPTLRGTPGLTRSWTPARDGDPEPSLGRPAYGVALLTRLPVAAWHERRMTSHWGRLPMALPTPSGRVAPMLVPDEPRAALAATVLTAAGPLLVGSTHLSFLPARAAVQLRGVTRWAGGLAEGGPAVLLGDLNLPGALVARVSGWTSLARRPTFPRESPRLQLDHALAAELGPWRVADAHTVAAEVSDHLALVVDLAS